MQDNENDAKKKTFTYFFGLFVMFSGASLFMLVIHPEQKLLAFKNISTMAAAFLGMVLSYNYKQEKGFIRFLKFTLGLIVIFVVCHFVEYFSVPTMVFVYTGAFWAFASDKIRIKFDERKSLIDEIEERKRLEKLKRDNENIASEYDKSE